MRHSQQFQNWYDAVLAALKEYGYQGIYTGDSAWDDYTAGYEIQAVVDNLILRDSSDLTEDDRSELDEEEGQL